MTLVLTELSAAGIAMAADTAITMFRDGEVVEVGKRIWRNGVHPVWWSVSDLGFKPRVGFQVRSSFHT
jgi:hypothetical protein